MGAGCRHAAAHGRSARRLTVMKTKMASVPIVIALACLLGSLSPLASHVSGQSDGNHPNTAGPPAGSGVPRTSVGKPELGGVWDFATITPLERPSHLAGKEFLTEAE